MPRRPSGFRRRLEIAALWVLIALVAVLMVIAVGWSFAGGVGATDRPLLEDVQHGQEDQQPQPGQSDQPDDDPQTDHNDS